MKKVFLLILGVALTFYLSNDIWAARGDINFDQEISRINERTRTTEGERQFMR